MKRTASFILGVIVFVLVTSQLSFAQLINWQRRNPTIPTGNRYTAPPAPAPAETAPAADNTTALKENFKVTNQDEELYDTNKDGVLQDEEVKAFLKDVAIAVDKKGSFDVSSDLLKEYDKN